MTTGQFLLGHLPQIIALPALLLAHAFFAGSETAFFSLSRADLLRMREGSHSLSRLVASLMRRPHALLMVLLLCTQLVHVAFFAVAATVLLDVYALRMHWAAQTALTIVPPLAAILFAEVMPKVLAVFSPVRVSQLAAVPLAVAVRVLGPLQGVLTRALIDPLTRLLAPGIGPQHGLTSVELAEALELSRQQRTLGARESDWIQEVVGLTRVKVAAIMVPRVDIVAHDIQQPSEGLVELFRRTRYKRMPVYRGSLDNIEGVIRTKELLLNPATDLTGLVRPVLFVPATATVDKLLLQFRRHRTQLAIVVDEYGGTAGLVTLQDALEEIVGEIPSPGEVLEEPVRSVAPGEYLVRADLGIHDWLDLFEVPQPEERVTTVGGLVLSLLGRVPKVGDAVEYGNLRLTVMTMRGRRIETLRIQSKEGQ